MSKRKQQQSKLESPPDDFCEWWNPTGIDELSGAAIGGHPDAERVWARKDSGRFTRRTYGIHALHAWNAQPYRDEYNAWVALGRPERETFVSLAATLDLQREFWRGVKADMKAAGKPMPKPLPTDMEVSDGAIDFE